MAYVRRIIKAGNVLIIDKYHTYRYGRKSSRGRIKNHTSEEQKRINERNAARNRIAKACANFEKGSKFYRLGYFDGERPDNIDEAHKRFCEFLKKIKRKCPELKYMGNTEEGSRGGLHHHLLVPEEFDAGLIDRYWRGSYHKRPVYSEDPVQLASYFTKGECADMFPERRRHTERRKKYTASRNLEKPVIYKQIIKKSDHWRDTPKSMKFEGVIYDFKNGSDWSDFTAEGYEYQHYIMIARKRRN